MQNRNWDSFHENMNHGIGAFQKSIVDRACRVDEARGGLKGLRDYCGIQSKACDYIYTLSDYTICIEFSDLYLQFLNSTIRTPQLKEIVKLLVKLGISRILRSSLNKLLTFEKIVIDEVVEKICASNRLIKHISSTKFDSIINMPSGLVTSKKLFLLVWYLPEDVDLITNARVLSDLEAKIKSKICNHELSQFPASDYFYILNIEQFIKLYCPETE